MLLQIWGAWYRVWQAYWVSIFIYFSNLIQQCNGYPFLPWIANILLTFFVLVLFSYLTCTAAISYALVKLFVYL